MHCRRYLPGLLFSGLLAVAATPAVAQIGVVDLDTVKAGKFDYGKMWPFEYAPADYYTDTYGFAANDEWFERARLSALRIPGCSASFVSPHGLVATNHHCVRGAVGRISGPGEGLLDNGFFAATLSDERPIPGYYADQLLAIEDVTDEVHAALDRESTDEARAAARGAAIEAIQKRARAAHSSAGDSLFIQVVGLYGGGRYSTYVFRRFTDVRLVFAAELEMGFFGGDPDNFTYPRYALDFAFLRIYEDGQPYEPTHYFGWGATGVEEGDAVFVIGNPGQTNRLATLGQIEFQREVTLPVTIAWLANTHRALGDFYRADPARGEEMGIRNRMFGLSNSLKAYTGRYEALENPYVMTKKMDGERQFLDAIAARPELAGSVAEVMEQISAIQAEKTDLAPQYAAFRGITSGAFSSATIRRAMAAYMYLDAQARGVSADSIAAYAEQLTGIADMPDELERSLLRQRLSDFERYLGANHPVTQLALQDGAPAATAAALLGSSALASAEATAAAVRDNTLSAEGAGVRLGAAIAPEYKKYDERWDALAAREQELMIDLGRARFDVYGESIPPDGTFSLRITDGIVKGYEYNGTLAPPYTTFYGVYDRHNAHKGNPDWALPERWQSPPPGLDLGTPLNFVSTADTYGGNSGSPAVTKDLALVGLNFDRNINGLSRDYLYLPEQGRNVMVDVRAIHASLDHVYDADRIVGELTTGTLYETEEAADAVSR